MGFAADEMLSCRVLKVLLGCSAWLLLWGVSYGSQLDIDCLKSIKATLQDPYNYLNSSWNFHNSTPGFICKFTGVECWHPDENRVLNIKLQNMALKGPFPRGLKNCTSITGLDLSTNDLYGPLPGDIADLIQYATTLVLSSNNFSGDIPDGVANLTFLNELKLDHNGFTGQIPLRIGQLGRIKSFSVANNLLSGPVPTFTHFPVAADSYADNPGLCGKPLDPCQNSEKGQTAVIVGAAIGGVTVAAIVLGISMTIYIRRVSKKKKKDDDPDGNKWTKILQGANGKKVSLFEKSIDKIKLGDLMKATNSFNRNNIIGSGRTGTVYKAVLDGGTSLMVKRLHDSQHSEKEFASEMATLGSVKHPNLVPLLGFCVAKKERLLVYKYMPNGTLHDQLHKLEEGKNPMDWSLRLRIGIRAAKGLAWLHHNCNPRIIHRNISSKCILLDADYEPKISDFGLARLMNPIDTHLSTFVNGEFGDLGYVAPEYARTLMATPKGDVYSFGVVLLELVTSERPTQVTKAPETFKGNLVEWITELSTNSQLHDAIDKSLQGKGVDNEVFQFLKIACKCVLSAPKERPSMFEVFQLLRAIGMRYNFTADDELLMPSDSGEINVMEELIVARGVKEEV